MQKQNFVQQMHRAMETLPDKTPLLLHACCAPCSSAVLEQLAQKFSITLLYYNPNIWPGKEYARRRNEQIELLRQLPLRHPVEFLQLPYTPAAFYTAVRGLENAPEGGARCEACFRLRLEEAAWQASARGIRWFTTTLSVSPHKNAPLLNAIGQALAAQYGLCYLTSDFKKQDGYKRSLQLSEQYGLYRQQYCGCQFSHRQRFGLSLGKK